MDFLLQFRIKDKAQSQNNMRYQNIREEELKNKVGQDFFAAFDSTKIVGNVDFCVTTPSSLGSAGEGFSLLWAEAKKGDFDVYAMFAQLILTIGKERTFDKYLPPAFLGAFDGKKIAFVPYNAIVAIFSLNDFNWNVTPSNHETKEFDIIKAQIHNSLQENHYLYDFEKDEAELKFFIKNSIAKATETGKILIDKNNFVSIYLRWLEQVKPSINFDWVEAKKQNIEDNEFYLADLFVDDKGTSNIDDDTPVNENLFVVFRNSHYEIAKENLKSLFNASIEIKDKKAYEQFWKKYKRPPVEDMQQYIIERKDLLVPQDIRERKGAFFTPKQWVALSQQYITDVLGHDWQEDYYVWDCAAGTGNLLAGLTNKYNIYASTLDQSDVNAMHDRIENGALLLKDNCFQFDFLNDDFSKLPQSLQNIINDPKKRKKLVVYINPPYAEHGNRNTFAGFGEHKSLVSKSSKVYENFNQIIGTAARELFTQFFIRIYKEIPNCHLASFSTLKYVSSQNFVKFRSYFKAEFKQGFICQASSFDNVKGKFPIGFLIWDLSKDLEITEVGTAIAINFENYAKTVGYKNFYSFLSKDFISNWLRKFYDKESDIIGYLILPGVDMQQQNGIYITLQPTKSDILQHKTGNITKNNLKIISIYLAVRHCIEATWLNDRDQFLYPSDGWQTDKEFQNDCLTYTLFHGQNKISTSKDGINHWIPFTEQEVGARAKFESNFMTQFIKGKISSETSNNDNLFEVHEPQAHYEVPLLFSDKAQAVFDAGRELWKYYHQSINKAPLSFGEGLGVRSVNASLYDIRDYFQGRNDKGKMNNKSEDEVYMQHIKALRESLKILAKKIEPKVYEYGFLKA